MVLAAAGVGGLHGLNPHPVVKTIILLWERHCGSSELKAAYSTRGTLAVLGN